MIDQQHSRLNMQNLGGETLLHKYARAGRYDMVEFLVRQGANIMIKDNEGSIPLHCAVRSGVVEVVKLLLTYNNVNELDRKEGCPFT